MTEQEYQAELAKRDEQIRGLSTKLGAHERVVRELGDHVERDAYGNPVRLVVANEPTTRTPMNANGHPLAPLSDYITGWNPQSADSYYQQMWEAQLNKSGYVTGKQAEEMAQRAFAMAEGNARVRRNYDKLTAQEKYKDLATPTSELSKRTARILQEREYGQPLDEKAAGFDEWRYRELGDLQYAADLSRMELAEEATAAAGAAASGQAAQDAAQLSAAPGGPAPAGAGHTVSDLINQQATSEAVLQALDHAVGA